MGYQREAIKGISWSGAIRLATRFLSFVKTYIIARILTPFDVGVFGIATLILTLIEVITETGINIFLVQQKDDIDKYINTAWIASILRGIIISACIVLSAPFVASFFHTQQATMMIQLISVVALLRGFINPSIIKLQKELQFHREFVYRTVLMCVETGVSISLLFLTHSVVSLVWGMIVSVAVEVVYSFIIVEPRPTFVFHREYFLRIVHSGKWVTASTIFNFAYQNGDNIAVGRLLNTTSLGLYDFAYRISLAPLSDFADVVGRVAFPVYVRIGSDKTRLKNAYIKTIGMLACIVIPIGLILSLFARPIIIILFGTKWEGAIPALQILGVFGIVRSLSVFTSSLFLALEKQHIVSLMSLVGFAGLLITIVPFVALWGIVGAAFSALFGTLLTFPIGIYYSWKYLHE